MLRTIGVDVNGTFADCYAAKPASGDGHVWKASSPPCDPAGAHACQRVIDVAVGVVVPKALPAGVLAAAKGANTTAVFSGIAPHSNDPLAARDAAALEGHRRGGTVSHSRLEAHNGPTGSER